MEENQKQDTAEQTNGIDASEQGHPQSPPVALGIPGTLPVFVPRGNMSSRDKVHAAQIVGVLQHGDPVLGAPVTRVVLVLALPSGDGDRALVDFDVAPDWLDRALVQSDGRDLVGGWLFAWLGGPLGWRSDEDFRREFTTSAPPPLPDPQLARGTAVMGGTRSEPVRQITSHQVNEANEQLRIDVMDEPGAGGASHHYRITGFDSGSNPSDPFTARHGTAALHSTVLFQNGPIGEVGVNGVTQEALLAIVVDRLEAFQRGRFACDENALALRHLQECIRHLHTRTKRRVKAGTEGTHQGS